ncbi:hypothetical protein D3C84_638930 [compost metagenome]
MVAALAETVGAAPDPVHARCCCHIGNRGAPTQLHHVVDALRLKDRREPEAHGVDRKNDAEVGARQDVDSAIAQHRSERVSPSRGRAQFTLQHLLFLDAQPACLGGMVAKVKIGKRTEQHAGQPFDQEHPLPPRKATHAFERGNQPGRKRTADNPPRRTCDEHDCNGPGHSFGAVPARQVIDHPRCETGFKNAKQKTHGVERWHVAHEQHAGRCDAP